MFLQYLPPTVVFSGKSCTLDLEETPEDLYILEIEIKKEELIFQIPDAHYSKDWLNTDNFACKKTW